MSSTSKRTASVISLGRRRGLAASAVSYGSGLSTQDERVDVGEGKTATEVEQLIAHLEQHGVIRCTLEDQPLENYTPPPNTGEPVREEDARQLYYYYCIPCECRLTSVSNKSASVAMLEDVHYHVSAATHRVAASCLPGEDLQPTLVQHPLVDPFLPRIDAEEELHPNYLRIHVNGLPFLISRRPGGGDLFFPIPLDPVFPPTEAVWYRPLTSIYSLMKQVIIRRRPAKSAHGHTRVVLKVLRAECEVQHVPMVDYLRQKHIVNRHIIPSTPAIIRFCPKVLPRPGESSATVNGSSKTIPRRHRVAYVAGVSDFIGYRRKRGMNAPQQLAMDRVSVKSEEVFRAGLLARTDSLFRRVFHNAVGDNDPSPQEATVSGQPPLPEEEPHAPLTQELLSTVVGYTVKGEASPSGSSNGSMSYASST